MRTSANLQLQLRFVRSSNPTGRKGPACGNLHPRIHEETGTVPIERWIAGSKSGNDNKKEPGDDRYDRWRTFYAMLQRPRCSGRMCDGVCALNRERKKREKIPLLYLTLYLFFQSFKAAFRGFIEFFRFGVIRFIRIRRN